MVRLALVLGVAALALAFADTAPAQTTQLLPGVTYRSDVLFTPFGPVALHVVRGPRPGGPYSLEPELSNESVVGRERVSSIERRLSSQGTSVGINGDYFAWKDGRPSGITLRDDTLVTAPSPDRSSLGISSDGTLDIRRVRLFGSFQGTGPRRALTAFNQAPGPDGMALFTSDWGPATPQFPGSYSVVLLPFPAATPNTDLQAPVVDFRWSQSVPLQPGLAVLVARGAAVQTLQAEAPVGAYLTVSLVLGPGWGTVANAIGGGPVLVRDGRPVLDANEGFTPSQLDPRDPRTAVGQTADGHILLVAVDGRQPGYSVGLTNLALAQEMMRLGAVQAMAFDSGGSTTLAFDGTVLNRPSDRSERPVSTALLLLYSGVYAPPASVPVVSPNGDGVDDTESLSYKVVRPSTVTVTLAGPDRTPAFQVTATRAPGTYRVPFPPPPPTQPPTPAGAQQPSQPTPLAQGRWTLTVAATDDEGVSSTATQRFAVNSTLASLRVAPRVLRLPPAGGSATIAWTQTRAAQLTVSITTSDGSLVRTLASRRFDPGDNSVVWNGRRRGGTLAYGGSYLVRIVARNGLGTVSLEHALPVRRTAG